MNNHKANTHLTISQVKKYSIASKAKAFLSSPPPSRLLLPILPPTACLALP